MLSASPAAPTGFARATAIAGAVRDVAGREGRAAADPARRPASLAGPSPRGRLDRQYVEAFRSQDPKGFRSMLATLRAQDRPEWRRMVRGMRAGRPAAWSLILSALRERFPGAPGVPAGQPGDVAAPTASPSLALPLGNNFDLGTRWSLVHTDDPSTYRSPAPVAMSADSTVWSVFPSDPETLDQYDPQGQAWYNVWQAPGPINSISAGYTDAGLGVPRSVYVSYTVNAQSSFVELTGPAQYGSYMNAGTAYPIPGNLGKAPTVQIAATHSVGNNQPLWALVNGVLWYWSGPDGRFRWSSVSTGGLKIDQITVASTNDLWAIATPPGTGQSAGAYELVGGTWKAGPALAGLSAIAGTPDGTVWAIASGGNVYTLSPDGSQWLPVTSLSAVGDQAPTTADVALPSGYGAFVAGSEYRAAAADPDGGVQLLTYGLADQPALGYPPMDPGEQAGYAYINQYLYITAPGGVRALYENASDVGNLSGYLSTLLGFSRDTAVPEGLSISLADWNAISTEVYNELFSVVAVDNYFSIDINPLTSEFNNQVPQLLSTTSQQVQLSATQQGSSHFGVIFNQIFSAALGGIVKAFSGPEGVAASLIASGINAAIADATKNQSNTSYSLTYYELSSMLSTIFSNAYATNAAMEAAILSDPSRFLPFGAAVESNTVGWPVETNAQIVGTTLDGFQTYFLRALTPLVWPLYYATGYADSMVEGCWPSYTSYFQPDSPDDGYGTLYVLGISGSSAYTFPDQSLQLIPTILDLTGATLPQLLTNQLGWFQPVQQSTNFFYAYCDEPVPPASAGSP